MTDATVLIIEDDPSLLRGLKDNFEENGYRVSTASDGKTGLEASVDINPDLIILDITLPEMNGFDLCSSVREQELEMPIIMLTADDQRESIVRGLDLGADDYVTKPFSIEELLARAKAFLRRRESGASVDQTKALVPGTRLGRYQIRSLLGRGGMSEVYRALDSKLGREVAIKVLPRQLARDPEYRIRFQREARAIAALSHANIVKIYDLGRDRGLTFAVTELLDGESLRDRLESGPLVWTEASRICAMVADGLATAHAEGLVHRDIKPGNIFLCSSGAARILDFGLVRIVSVAGHPLSDNAPTPSAPTSAGKILGTVGYMSPEQVRGEKADARSDLFSLGCVLHELISGRSPFSRTTAVETMAAVLAENPPLLAGIGLAMPRRLSRVVERCLAKDPEERFHCAGDLASALRGVLSSHEAP